MRQRWDLAINLIEMISVWMVSLISTTGYAGIYLSMVVEGIMTPLPSELIIPFAGYLASTGELNIVLIILIASLGACCGSFVAYLIGKRLGRPFICRYGRYVGVREDDLGRADRWFERWGNYGVLLGHSLPGVRSIISFPAGIAHMNARRFVLFTFLGAMVWNTVLTVAGYALGSYWMELSKSMDGWDIIILAAVGVAFLAFVLNGRRKRREQARSEGDRCE